MPRTIGWGRYKSETYPTAAGRGGGDSVCPPLSGNYFVDSATTVPLANQNGSACAPFATIQQAIDAGVAASAPSIGIALASLLFIGDNPVVPNGHSVTLRASTLAIVGSLSVGSGSSALMSGVLVGGLTLGALSVCEFLEEGGIASGAAVTSTGSGASLVLAGPAQRREISLGFDMQMSGSVTLEDGNFEASCAAVAGPVNLSGTGAGKASFIDSDISGSSNVTTGTLRIDDCRIAAGSFTVSGKTQLIDTEIDASVAFDNSPTDPFQVDGFSNYWLNASGSTLTSPGQKVVTELP